MTAKGLKLRPSDASRWTVCTMSPYFVLANADRIIEEKRDYTDEGSRAHKLAESILRNETAPEADNAEMQMHVKGYVAHVRKKVKGDVDLLIEQEIACYYNPEQRGFIDAITVSGDGKKVFIDDLKYGAGVSVEARHNKQMAIYARSFMDQYSGLYGFLDDTLIIMCIYQPRIVGEEPVRLWSVTYKELVDWTDDNITAIAADILDNPQDQCFAPGEDTCRFCPAQAICSAYAEWQLTGTESVLPRAAVLSEREFHPPEPEALSEAQIAAVVENGKGIKKWIDTVLDYASSAMASGQLELPGLKVVASSGHRKWADEAQAETLLKSVFKKDEYTTSKLVTPAQVEKLFKARKRTKKLVGVEEAVMQIITKPEGGPTIVPLSDKRPSIALRLEAEFEDVINVEAEEDLL